MRGLRGALTAAHRFEDALLAALLIVMMTLAVTQIILRNGFDSGLLWADSLLRVLVLWIALIGAIVGARERQHISMDLVTRFLSGRWKLVVQALTGFFASVICSALAWYTFDFVQIERESGTIAFSGVPAWMFEAVMPVAFAIMAVRYLLQTGLVLAGTEQGAQP